MITISIRNIEKASRQLLAFLFLFSIAGSHAIAKEETGAKEDGELPKPSHTLYFSLSDQHGFPLQESKGEFDCSDKIYTTIELSHYPLGKHHFSVVWTDPAGDDRERTEYDFHVRDHAQPTRLWSWLSLRRSTGSGMLQWLNPAAGLEEFIGPWKVEVRIDNKKIDAQSFEVSC